MYRRILLITIALLPCNAFAQNTITRNPGQMTQDRESAKDSSTTTAAASGPNIEVSKTAFVNGENVCGAIRIMNVGGQPAIINRIADSLEVHFPRDGSSTLPAGSTKTWYKVADVPIPLPGSIAAGKTATINYCFSLCIAADAPGANSMRNVVAVSATNQSGSVKAMTTRSVSFPPPILDCQACCRPDGSCTDTLPGSCVIIGGLPRGSGTDCATTECPQACCHPDGTCADQGPSACQTGGGQASGPGTNCASTQCCIELGASGCSATSECCPREGETVPCNAGRCCLSPAGLPAVAGCSDDSACCAGTCHDFSGDFGGGTGCCFEPGTSGCSATSECCPREGETVPCNAGRCCLPPGAAPSVAGCSDDAICCAGTCHVFSDFGGGTGCCFEPGTSGCSANGECCTLEREPVPCNAGRCCLPPAGPLGIVPCPDDTACCAGTCHVFNDVGGRCCFELGTSGCSADTQCCNSLNGATCNAGTCCISTGTTGCTESAQCCNHNAICGSGNTCCIPQFRTGCSGDSDCCSGLVCTNGECEGVFLP